MSDDGGLPHQHPFPKWIVVILLVLTPFIGLFDVVFGSLAYSTLFVGELGQVEGKILTSSVTTGTDSDGDTNYSVSITYRYEVDGTFHEGAGTGFGDFNLFSSSNSWAQEAVDQYPEGSTATIYYERSNPANSALSPEADGIWAVPMLLLTPFNVALIILWLGAINMVRRRGWTARQLDRPNIESAPPGTELLADGPHIRLRAVNISPLLAGLIGAGVTGFLCTFAGAAATLIFDFGPLVVLGGFGVALVFGAGLPWWLRKRHLETGVKDLVVDLKGRCLAWDGGDPSGPNSRAFDDFNKVEVEKKVTSSRSSDGSTSTKTDYIVWLHTTRGPSESLYKFGNEPTKADAIAVWLRHVLGLRTA